MRVAPASPRQAALLAGVPGGLCNFNLQIVLRFSGPLDRPALVDALEDLMQRQETLRTTLRSAPAGAELAIWAGMPAPLEEVDLSDAPDELDERIKVFTEIPAQLDGGALWGACLFRLDPDAHVLVLRLHHVTSDGWSLDVITWELKELYRARALGRPSLLVPPTVQFRDFVTHERAAATPAVRDWWAKQLPPRSRAATEVFDPMTVEPLPTVVQSST